MIMSRTQQTITSSANDPISPGELAYYNQRLRNQIFANILEAFAKEAESGRITKASLARKLGKKPEQITRWFSGPSNWTLDTVSCLLRGLDAELETRVVLLKDRVRPNYRHSLVDFLEGTDKAPYYGEMNEGPDYVTIASTQSPNSVKKSFMEVHFNTDIENK